MLTPWSFKYQNSQRGYWFLHKKNNGLQGGCGGHETPCIFFIFFSGGPHSPEPPLQTHKFYREDPRTPLQIFNLNPPYKFYFYLFRRRTPEPPPICFWGGLLSPHANHFYREDPRKGLQKPFAKPGIINIYMRPGVVVSVSLSFPLSAHEARNICKKINFDTSLQKFQWFKIFFSVI